MYGHVQAFLECFEGWAAKAGVGVEDTTQEQEAFELYQRARITARLVGSEPRFQWLVVLEKELGEVCAEVKQQEDMLEEVALYLHRYAEVGKLRRLVNSIKKKK